ncbi:MAG: hypothetical protein ABIG68_13020, partial [Acidobacteriota bacterium]
ALDCKLNESIKSLSGLPEKLQSLASQIDHVDQRYRPLADVLAPGDGEGVPRKITDLDKTVASLRNDAGQVQARLQRMEHMLANTAAAPRTDADPMRHPEMTAIRSSLDEIRRFMVELNRKL